jgi:hypothetical protein
VIVATKDKIPSLLQAAKTCPQLKLIIQMEKEGDKTIQVSPSLLFSALLVFCSFSCSRARRVTGAGAGRGHQAAVL